MSSGILGRPVLYVIFALGGVGKAPLLKRPDGAYIYIYIYTDKAELKLDRRWGEGKRESSSPPKWKRESSARQKGQGKTLAASFDIHFH